MNINKWLEQTSEESLRKNRNSSNEFELLQNAKIRGWRFRHENIFSTGRKVKTYNCHELKKNYLERKRAKLKLQETTRNRNSKSFFFQK